MIESVSRLRTLLIRHRWFSIFALLVLSLHSIKKIPRYSGFTDYYFGYDFWNLYKFQNCIYSANPYVVAADACGDGRGMVYPPVIYLAYQWTRDLVFPTALWIYIAFMALSLVGVGIYWSRESFKKVAFLIPLVILQFPGTYAFERANNDIFPVILWTLSSWSYLGSQYRLAGVLAGWAVAMKIYPAIAVFIVCVAGLLAIGSKSLSRMSKLIPQHWFQFGLSALLTFIVLFLVTWKQSVPYFLEILPKWSAQTQGREVHVHSFWSIIGKPAILTWVLFLGLAIRWRKFIAELYKKDSEFLFALALAVSTFFQKVSNDYNLITIYPLAFLLLSRLFSEKFKSNIEGYFKALSTCILFLLGWRFLWNNPIWNIGGTQIIFQYLWFYSLPRWIK
jgi:hypothetical protein